MGATVGMNLALSVVALVLLVAVVVAAITLPIEYSQARRLAGVKEHLGVQHAWLAVAERGTHTSVLVVDDNTIQLVALDGSREQTWSKSQLATVDDAGVLRGAFRRPGLRLGFADRGNPTGSLAVLFPAFGGLIPSSKARSEVRAALLGSDLGPGIA